MTPNDRYVKIREALEMGPTPGPFSVSRSYSPGNQELILLLTYKDEHCITENYCTVRNRLGDTWKTEANAAYIAACDPDTIRELLAERDRLKERVAELERERDQLLDKLHCMCGSPIDHSAWEGHTPVSVYDYSLDRERSRAEAAEARLTSERAAHAETKRERDEAFQKYVDANEARIDAEAQRDEAMKALDALDRMNRGLDWCDQDEQARRWSAARKFLKENGNGE